MSIGFSNYNFDADRMSADSLDVKKEHSFKMADILDEQVILGKKKYPSSKLLNFAKGTPDNQSNCTDLSYESIKKDSNYATIVLPPSIAGKGNSNASTFQGHLPGSRNPTGPTLETEFTGTEFFEFPGTNTLGTMPSRIFCVNCKSQVTTSTRIQSSGFWQCLFDGIRCCKDGFSSGRWVVHSCTRCRVEIGRVKLII